MGLDMYMFIIKDDEPENEDEIGYWRKANHIHRWFIEHVFNGEDDNCNKIKVSKKQLQNLLFVCKQVNKDNDRAEELLPTQEGFFFGGTDYDEYYFGSIDETIKIIEQALEKLEKGYTAYYNAWW